MSKPYFRLRAYIKYLFTAQIGATVHSPFIYSFAKEVLKRRINKGFYRPINQYRQKLFFDNSIVDKKDFGTGKSKTFKTSSLAKKSSVSKYYGRLLSKTSRFQNPKNILELGTCLGVSSLYLTIGMENIALTSVEGCLATFQKRVELFKTFGLEKPQFQFINSDFDQFLQDIDEKSFDLIFIDGNHSYEATKRYFEKLWPLIPDGGLIIFDDIHWSLQMEKAWIEIIGGNEKMVSIDLFQFGMCFKRVNQATEHFILRY